MTPRRSERRVKRVGWHPGLHNREQQASRGTTLKHPITSSHRRALLGFVFALTAPTHAAHAFGGGDALGECATFTTCTATAGSGTNTFVQHNFQSIGSSYVLDTVYTPGINQAQDIDNRETTATVIAQIPDTACFPNCAYPNFFSAAVARAQSDFGTNRASAETSAGGSGTDSQGSIGDAARSATVQILTIAGASSTWRDVWSFNTDGHFSAKVAIDGQSSTLSSNGFFPDSFDFTVGTTLGEWYYDLDVWDVTNLSVSVDFETGGPTLIARLRDRTGNANEQRPSFGSALDLDFDFMRDVSYVVVAQLGVNARNGRDVNLFNTAQLTDVALSSGAQLTALSGHDYLATVPAPGSALLLLSGLAGMAMKSRFRRAANVKLLRGLPC